MTKRLEEGQRAAYKKPLTPNERCRNNFTTGQVARLLEVSMRTVTLWCQSGLLKYHTITSKTHKDKRIPKGDLLRFVLEHDLPGADLLVAPRVLVLGLPENHVLELRRLLELTNLEVAGEKDLFRAGLHLGMLPVGHLIVDADQIGRTATLGVIETLREPFAAVKIHVLVNQDDLDPGMWRQGVHILPATTTPLQLARSIVGKENTNGRGHAEGKKVTPHP